jgi:hypothetical protein
MKGACKQLIIIPENMSMAHNIAALIYGLLINLDFRMTMQLIIQRARTTKENII